MPENRSCRAEMRALIAAATQVGWSTGTGPHWGCDVRPNIAWCGGENGLNDARLIAAMANAMPGLLDELDAKDARIAELERERDEAIARAEKAEARVNSNTDWYQQRFNALRRWVNNEVLPLSKEVAHRYFAICANGSPSPHESADWKDTLHTRDMQIEQLKTQLADRAKYDEDLRALLRFALSVENAELVPLSKASRFNRLLSAPYWKGGE